MANIKDGTAEFVVCDKRYQAIVDLVYPVGSVVAIANNTKPKFMEYGTWKEIANGRVLQGGNNPGSTVEAGLPNIEGRYASVSNGGANLILGAFSTSSIIANNAPKEGGSGNWYNMYFDASKSNTIYGKSNTVQPPAYIVKFYRRTA